MNDEMRDNLTELIANMRGVTIELVDVLTTKVWLTWDDEDRELLRKFVLVTSTKTVKGRVVRLPRQRRRLTSFWPKRSK
jgi:hypothetical protein